MQLFGVLVCATNIQKNFFVSLQTVNLSVCTTPFNKSVFVLTVAQLQKTDFYLTCFGLLK